MRTFHQVSRFLAAAVVLVTMSTAQAAEDGAWTVSKSSGEVWLTSSGAQPASLTQEALLRPGDTVRTGRTGRVLLRRGEETMLVSPNSVVGMPAAKEHGLSTTIVQQAGSILLEVEKRKVKHFEVETPYLAAVVKGTRFRVTINARSTSVDVIRGQVEVADFRSGQIAQVMPGQHATAFAHGKAGLSLSGSGTFNPIEHGKPRTPSIQRIPVPRAGLSAPRHAANRPTVPLSRHALAHAARTGVTRISSSIGEVRLNFHSVTHGLARGKSAAHGGTQHAAHNDTIWSSSGSGANPAVANNGVNNGAGGNSSAAASVRATIAAVGGSGNGNGNGNGNGANGSGNNGNHYGNSNGNNGNHYGNFKKN